MIYDLQFIIYDFRRSEHQGDPFEHLLFFSLRPFDGRAFGFFRRLADTHHAADRLDPRIHLDLTLLTVAQDCQQAIRMDVALVQG